MKSKFLPLLTACALACSFGDAYGDIIFDGTITDSDWGPAFSTSSGGPVPGFGAGHEINAIYADGDLANIFFGIAGNVQNGSRIMLFIDSKSGGLAGGNFDRTNAPQGLDDFNAGTTFDPGFLPDHVLTIGTNAGHSNFFFDLYTLSANPGGGSNTFLGSSNDSAADALSAAPANGSTTAGFELALSKAVLGTNLSTIRVFAAYTSDAGFLSNQFLTRAGNGEGNYGSSPITFGALAPDPVLIPASAVPEPSVAAMLGSTLLGSALLMRRRR